MKHSCMAALLAGVASVTINLPATAQEQASSDVGTLDQGAAEKLFPKKRAYSPYAGRNFPSRPLFGDTHLHTSFSFDAGAFGARLGPVDAYRFAKGEQVVASSGQPAKLSRPLDFLVVADHSDNMGFFPDLLAAKPNIMADPTGRKWHDMIVGGQGAAAAIEIIVAFSQNKFPKALLYSPQRRVSLRVAGNHQGGGTGERAGAVYRLHRLRMDVQHRRQQPAPQRHLPRQRREGQPGRAVHGARPVRQRQPAGPLEMDGGLRGEDRRAGARHRSQWEPVQRTHVPHRRAGNRQAHRPRICGDAREVGAPLRGDANQGGRGDPSLPIAERRPTSSAGTRATLT